MGISEGFAQALYDTQSLQKIELQFSQPNWDYQMDTAKLGSEGYLMANWVKINGVTYDSVGVKYKGNSSFDSTRLKNPLHIELNTFKSQHIQGFKDIKLSNGYGDPSFQREVLAYDMLQNYMDCPRANFAQVYINGNYIGLYSSAENIDKKFCGDHFGNTTGTFVKCNPIINPSPAIKSNLKFINSDSSSYANLYEIKSNSGWNVLTELCDSLSNTPTSVHRQMDIDRALWMLAFNNLIINLDSYSGVFSQNYYIYKNQTQLFNSIVWDLNMSFGAFPFGGNGTASMGTLNIAGMQNLSVAQHATDPNWPLIKAIQENSTFKRMYIAHLRTMLNEQIISTNYKTKFNQFKALIDTAVQSDMNGFFNYSQFSGASNTDYPFGSYTVPGVFNLMDARASYLQSTPEFQAVSPAISNINTLPATLTLGSAFTLRANVQQATQVWVGYRYAMHDVFTKDTLYDDGQHNDGAAQDGVYGVSINMNKPFLQYYIYAENANAGIFAPERAEHEFYTLTVASQTPSLGQLVINEVLADNTTGIKDEYNDREDWIELFNTSNQTLDLSNVYLSDDTHNPLKWKIPNNTLLEPNGFMTVWADDQEYQLPRHCNFNMNKTMDTVLLSLGNATLLDSTTFSNQLSNISWGRFPNGTGSFQTMNTSYNTYNNNWPLSISVLEKNKVQIFPNPANNQMHIQCEGKQELVVANMLGQVFYKGSMQGSTTLNTGNWPNGIYLLRCGHITKQISILH
ncbi:MAG: CotH kinase family protein [Chitinophagaceae bacterium]